MVVASIRFAFRAYHASTNLKKFSSSKLDKFTKQELITRARLRGQDFATGKNFSFNQCHTKSFAFFSRESYFIKAIENFFPVFA